MQMNLETVGRRFVDSRRTSSNQLPNQPLGFVEVPAQKSTPRAFKTQGECELVLTWIVQAVTAYQRHAGRKMNGRRHIGRRRLGLSSGTQVDLRHLRFFVP